MAEDLDVDAMLEAPYSKGDDQFNNSKHKENGYSDGQAGSSSRSRGRSRSRSKDREYRDKDKKHRHRDRDKDRDKDHRRHREKDRDKDRRREDRSDRDRDRDKDKRKRSTSRDKRRSRSRSPPTLKNRGKSPLPLPPRLGKFYPRVGKRSPSPLRSNQLEELTPEERDARTIFCMQLSQRVRARDLEEFFSSVGKVRDVRLITCNKTRRFKGIAYIEFKEMESVALAIGLNGQKLLGIPIVVQPTQAEKNRVAGAAAAAAAAATHKGGLGMTGPMRLYVGSLHFNITEEMLRGIFEPFGRIDNIQLIVDSETNRSKGYGFISFHDAEDAKKALEQLNGFELAGRPMKVGHVTERTDTSSGPSLLDSDELDRSGIDLGATGRLQLMAKLAEGTGLQIPQPAAAALNMNSMNPIASQSVAPPIATQCFMLSNMFDPAQETNPNWAQEIFDDVIDECNKHGGVYHVYVDRTSSQGNVYVKCPSIATAVAAIASLHGRWFAGRIITAAYVPLVTYHNLFPEAMTASQLLVTRRSV